MTGACPHAVVPELGAYVDGELGGAARAWWEEHVRGCRRCRDEIERLRTLSGTLRTSLPTSEPSSALRESVRQLVRDPGAAPVDHTVTAMIRSRPWRAAVAALLLLGAGFGLGRIGGIGRSGEGLDAALVGAHVRSLQVDHLVDVASSEHHVVKPWFAGKLDFSPPVPDLAPAGFPLLGARTEYIAGRTVAALVYASGPHRINLFVWPAASAGACGQTPPTTPDGFNLIHGRTTSMELWAVSDLNATELRTFTADWLHEAGC